MHVDILDKSVRHQPAALHTLCWSKTSNTEHRANDQQLIHTHVRKIRKRTLTVCQHFIHTSKSIICCSAAVHKSNGRQNKTHLFYMQASKTHCWFILSKEQNALLFAHNLKAEVSNTFSPAPVNQQIKRRNWKKIQQFHYKGGATLSIEFTFRVSFAQAAKTLLMLFHTDIYSQ